MFWVEFLIKNKHPGLARWLSWVMLLTPKPEDLVWVRTHMVGDSCKLSSHTSSSNDKYVKSEKPWLHRLTLCEEHRRGNFYCFSLWSPATLVRIQSLLYRVFFTHSLNRGTLILAGVGLGSINIYVELF